MEIKSLTLGGVKLLRPKRFEDARGHFVESYNKARLQAAGLAHGFVQDNQSFSVKKNTIRGLHFQRPPYAQTKLVSVLKGAILDIIIDLRKTSSTYLKSEKIELSEQEGWQLLVPKGFAHGFMTLEDETLVSYKVDEFYAPDHEETLIWNDQALNLDWGDVGNGPHLSDKDRAGKSLTRLDNPF